MTTALKVSTSTDDSAPRPNPRNLLAEDLFHTVIGRSGISLSQEVSTLIRGIIVALHANPDDLPSHLESAQAKCVVLQDQDQGYSAAVQGIKSIVAVTGIKDVVEYDYDFTARKTFRKATEGTICAVRQESEQVFKDGGMPKTRFLKINYLESTATRVEKLHGKEHPKHVAIFKAAVEDYIETLSKRAELALAR